MNKPLVVIVGPTASGKSALGMEIARRFDGEIICADSRTVYKGMDIGTAKPTVEDQAEIRHHLLDVVEPSDSFTAAEFKRLATEAIGDITARGKLPIMVGGSGLYVDSVVFDYQFGPEADQTLRDSLNLMTTPELQSMCRENDIEVPNNSSNRRHLIRALELGGLRKDRRGIRSDTIVVGITTEREKLRQRIERRAQEMVSEGVLAEVRQLGERYGWESEAMTGNIYRIFRSVIDGELSEQDALEEFVRSDMRLAKRQMTWFKRNPHILWSDSPEVLITKVDQFLSEYSRLR